MYRNFPRETGGKIYPNANDLVWSVTDHITAMLAYWDTNQVCRFANNAYLEWFGKSKQDMIDKMTMKELLGPLYDLNLPHILGALSGKKQVFEREIPMAGGGSRHSLATYIPDIAEGKVKGFFVHVADVTYIKELEGRLLSARRETIGAVIEMQENERSEIAAAITEDINQALASCNILLYADKMNDDHETTISSVMSVLRATISDLNEISIMLRPPGIETLGFVASVESYIQYLKPNHLQRILFNHRGKKIESLSISNKRFVFRIIQSFIHMVNEKKTSLSLEIEVTQKSDRMQLLFRINDKNYVLNRHCKQFKDIAYRVDYCNGLIEEKIVGNEKVVSIVFRVE